jgi:hypothetical protein
VKPRVVTAVALPDPRIDQTRYPGRLVIVVVTTDDEHVWHCYPDGDCLCYPLPKMGTRRTKPKPGDR